MNFNFFRKRAPSLNSVKTAESEDSIEFLSAIVDVADRSNIGLAVTYSKTRKLSDSFENVFTRLNQASLALEKIQKSSESLKALTGRSRAEVQKSAHSTIAGLTFQAQELGRAVELIQEIGKETSILSLNAAIEANRAGEHGKSFGVVATEVQRLAEKSLSSIQEIKMMSNQVSESTEAARETLKVDTQDIKQIHSGSQIELVKKNIQAAMDGIVALNSIIEEITKATEENYSIVEGVRVEIDYLRKHFDDSKAVLKEVSDQALHITEFGEDIFSTILKLDADTFHNQIMKKAQLAAREIVAAFEKAIESGQITKQQLFSRDYIKMPNTNPQKFRSSFDQFTDQKLPEIQEPLLTGRVVYAFAVNVDGYVPTHNDKFSQPLTGNYETDLVKNRTKRLFNDRVGLRCGQNRRPGLLQTYLRDTGEILHDLSVPIFIQGELWGNFRVGYNPETGG